MGTTALKNAKQKHIVKIGKRAELKTLRFISERLSIRDPRADKSITERM
jgi:hypothetical protein